MTTDELTTASFEAIREEIDYVLNTRRIRVTKTLLENLEHESDEEYTLEDIKRYVELGNDADISPLINFILTADDVDGDAIKPKTATEPESEARRQWVLEKLGLTDIVDSINARIPVKEQPTVIDTDFVDWYKGDRRTANANYWPIYEEVLKGKGWNADSISAVSRQATEVIRRLDDPLGPMAGGKRGLVVGHVQSGKTANFTAVMAKAIDAGYRFVIVLAGTLDILRNQTQRRLDMELFGREAILDGRSEDNLTPYDYKAESYFADDSDWDIDWDRERRGFVRHGGAVGATGYPKVRRITTSVSDFKGSAGASLVDIPLRSPEKPLNHPDNLLNASCHAAVVKKNSSVLKKLNSDLSRLGPAIVRDLPVLIIDDESDQASINTVNPTKYKSKEEVERTAVNREITRLLNHFPRSQYVGYTATPFANVFVDPEDPEDLYPRDFALMLTEPPGYRGAAWFHDRHQQFEDDPEPTVETSRSMAFIRDIAESPKKNVDEFDFGFESVRKGELQEALDMFVLTGAIKKYREANSNHHFEHHTMLVHEAVDTATHEEAWTLLKGLWSRSNYAEGGRNAELKKLFDDQVKPVMDVERYSEGAPVPPTFDALMPDAFTNYITAAAQMMMGDSAEPPILQVNSIGGDEVDFERSPVWKVLVGGTKLSRGYTVEGLTVSYFRRKAGSADTLMQTGRWFGFRKGYQDLVRLYAPPTLVGMFEAAMGDENHFRNMLKKYAELEEDGKAKITPIQLAPLVRQSLPHLSPTSTNKMFNAFIKLVASAPNIAELNQVPLQDAYEHKKWNIEEVAIPLLCGMSSETHDLAYVRYESSKKGEGTTVSAGFTPSHTTVVGAEEIIDLLTAIRWRGDDADARDIYYKQVVFPRIQYLADLMGTDPDGLGGDSRFTEVAVIMARPKKTDRKGKQRTIRLPGVNFDVPVVRRSRRLGKGRNDITGSDRKQSYALESIAAGLPCTYPRRGDLDMLTKDQLDSFNSHPTAFPVDPSAEPFNLDTFDRRTRGAVLITLFDDRPKELLKAMDDSETWIAPDYLNGEVGMQISFNSPHAPIDGAGHDAIVWGVHVPAKKDQATVAKDEVEDPEAMSVS